jgi:hypothetical protein
VKTENSIQSVDRKIPSVYRQQYIECTETTVYIEYTNNSMQKERTQQYTERTQTTVYRENTENSIRRVHKQEYVKQIRYHF